MLGAVGVQPRTESCEPAPTRPFIDKTQKITISTAPSRLPARRLLRSPVPARQRGTELQSRLFLCIYLVHHFMKRSYLPLIHIVGMDVFVRSLQPIASLITHPVGGKTRRSFRININIGIEEKNMVQGTLKMFLTGRI